MRLWSRVTRSASTTSPGSGGRHAQPAGGGRREAQRAEQARAGQGERRGRVRPRPGQVEREVGVEASDLETRASQVDVADLDATASAACARAERSLEAGGRCAAGRHSGEGRERPGQGPPQGALEHRGEVVGSELGGPGELAVGRLVHARLKAQAAGGRERGPDLAAPCRGDGGALSRRARARARIGSATSHRTGCPTAAGSHRPRRSRGRAECSRRPQPASSRSPVSPSAMRAPSVDVNPAWRRVIGPAARPTAGRAERDGEVCGGGAGESEVVRHDIE